MPGHVEQVSSSQTEVRLPKGALPSINLTYPYRGIINGTVGINIPHSTPPRGAIQKKSSMVGMMNSALSLKPN